MALFDANKDDKLYQTKLQARSDDWIRFFGCANIKLEMSWDGYHKLNALVYTNNLMLSLVQFGFDNSLIQELDNLASNSQPIIRMTPYTLSKQKLFMLSEFSGLRFKVTQNFISALGPLSGGRSNNLDWGFVMNTDDSGIRRTQLWERFSYYVEASATRIDSNSLTTE